MGPRMTQEARAAVTPSRRAGAREEFMIRLAIRLTREAVMASGAPR